MNSMLQDNFILIREIKPAMSSSASEVERCVVLFRMPQGGSIQELNNECSRQSILDLLRDLHQLRPDEMVARFILMDHYMSYQDLKLMLNRLLHSLQEEVWNYPRIVQFFDRSNASWVHNQLNNQVGKIEQIESRINSLDSRLISAEQSLQEFSAQISRLLHSQRTSSAAPAPASQTKVNPSSPTNTKLSVREMMQLCSVSLPRLVTWTAEMKRLSNHLADSQSRSLSLQSNRIFLTDYLMSHLKFLFKGSVYLLNPDPIVHTVPDCPSLVVLALNIGKVFAESWLDILHEHLSSMFGGFSPEITSLISSETITEPIPSAVDDDEQTEPSRISLTELQRHLPGESSSGLPLSPIPCLSFRLNNVPFLVHSRPIPSLCFSSFLQEADDFIGNDHLLSRSFSFIHEFFSSLVPSASNPPEDHYNDRGLSSISFDKMFLRPFASTTTTPAASLPSHFVSPAVPPLFPSSPIEDGSLYDADTMLWIIVLSVFNKFSSAIHNPLHALVHLLLEYMPFNAQSHIVSIYGLLEIPQNLSIDPLSPSHHQYHQHHYLHQRQLQQQRPFPGQPLGAGSVLLPMPVHNSAWHFPKQLLEKYYSLMDLPSVRPSMEARKPPTGNHNKRKEVAAPTTSPTLPDFAAKSIKLQTTPAMFSKKSHSSCLLLHPFTRQLFVLPMGFPFLSSGVMVQAISRLAGFIQQSNLLPITTSFHDKYYLLAQTMLPGSSSLSSSLSMPSVGRDGGERELLNSTAVRADHSHVAIWSSNEGKEYFHHAISYCFLFEYSLFSDVALMNACRDILDMCGALPVGEIGKLLTFQMDSNQIMNAIRDNYKGFKLFLEKYPDIFVFFEDHTFNPHVYLRDKISLEHQSLMQFQRIETSAALPSSSSSSSSLSLSSSLLLLSPSSSSAWSPWSSALSTSNVLPHRDTAEDISSIQSTDNVPLAAYLPLNLLTKYRKGKPSKKIMKQIAVMRRSQMEQQQPNQQYQPQLDTDSQDQSEDSPN